MTKDKIIEVVKFYNKILCGTDPVKYPSDKMIDIIENGDEALRHCRYMIDEIKELIKQGKTEKAFRWLGFVQGCFWTMGIFTIDQLKNCNKPS